MSIVLFHTFQNFWDWHILASIAWNCAKINIKNDYYKKLHSSSVCANSSLGRCYTVFS